MSKDLKDNDYKTDTSPGGSSEFLEDQKQLNDPEKPAQVSLVILDKKFDGKIPVCKVWWVGYGDDFVTWELLQAISTLAERNPSFIMWANGISAAPSMKRSFAEAISGKKGPSYKIYKSTLSGGGPSLADFIAGRPGKVIKIDPKKAAIAPVYT